MNKFDRTTSEENVCSENVCSANVCSENVCSANVCSENVCSSENSECSECLYKAAIDSIRTILEWLSLGVSPKNTPGHEKSERSVSSVQFHRLVNTVNLIHEKCNTIITMLDNLPDCTNCWANMGEHEKSERSEYQKPIFPHSAQRAWSVNKYKEFFDDSRIANTWYYIRSYLYAPVQDILTDCADYLFDWLYDHITAMTTTEDITDIQDISCYLEAFSEFYDFVKSHRDHMPISRYDGFVKLLSDIDIILSERSDSEVSKMGGDVNE